MEDDGPVEGSEAAFEGNEVAAGPGFGIFDTCSVWLPNSAYMLTT